VLKQQNTMQKGEKGVFVDFFKNNDFYCSSLNATFVN